MTGDATRVTRVDTQTFTILDTLPLFLFRLMAMRTTVPTMDVDLRALVGRFTTPTKTGASTR